MTSEFSRIARLRSIFGEPPGALGIGDDAAVLPSSLDAVVTVDVAVEGVHFTRALLSLQDASARAVEAAMSDAAAMGARVDVTGCGLLLAWTLPRDVSDEDLDALAHGAQRAARRAGTWVVGGNLSLAPTLTLTTTVLARADGAVKTRSSARAGEVIAVTGAPGAAALGLRALLANALKIDGIDAFIDRWRHPQARLREGRALETSGAMIDLSDGLCQDAEHLARASGVRLVIDADALPMLAAQRECAARLHEDATRLALSGGEDYELLATGPRACFDDAWRVIGRVESGSGVVVMQNGRALETPAGWDHFG